MDLKDQFQDGGMFFSPDSTPSSTSPIDLLSQILNEDDDFDKLGSIGERSQRPSDEECEDTNYHLPLFKRGAATKNAHAHAPLTFSGLDFLSFKTSAFGSDGYPAASSGSDLSPPGSSSIYGDYSQGLPSPPYMSDSFQKANSNHNGRYTMPNSASAISSCDNSATAMLPNDNYKNAMLPSHLSRGSGGLPLYNQIDMMPPTSISGATTSLSAIGQGRYNLSNYNNSELNYPAASNNTSSSDYNNYSLASNYSSSASNYQQPQCDDLDILNQAVSLAAMSLGDKMPAGDSLDTQQALANLAALAQINEVQQYQQPQQGLSRQFSYPPENYSQHPPAMYGRSNPNQSVMAAGNGYPGNSWKYDSHQTRNSNGMMGGINGFKPPAINEFNGYKPSGMNDFKSNPMARMPLRSSLSSPVGDLGDYMQIRCKFGHLGSEPGMFNAPHGFCIGRNEEIIVADTNNHRIEVFDKYGTFMFMFGRPGMEEGCLWHPRKVAVLRHNGHFVVCDKGLERSRMQVFNERGMFLRRISIRFVDIVAGLATTSDGMVVVVDSMKPTIFILNPENGKQLGFLECADFMIEPSDIAIYKDDFYICDFKGHSVVVISSKGQFLRKIRTDSVSKYPNGIDISDAGDILVGDSHGNQFHVAIFDQFGQFVSHYHCPQVKVSRCCGLKLTSEGLIVTVAKNNHHVLVLNTLYVA